MAALGGRRTLLRMKTIATVLRRIATYPLSLLYVAVVIYSRRKQWFQPRST